MKFGPIELYLSDPNLPGRITVFGTYGGLLMGTIISTGLMSVG
jgi:hypothetical protein